MSTSDQQKFEQDQRAVKVESMALALLRSEVAAHGLEESMRLSVDGMPVCVMEAFALADKFEEAARARRR